jgi:hypothetical protein
MIFSMMRKIMLTRLAKTVLAFFVAKFYLYSAPYTTIPTMRHPDPALSTGFEIVSLSDQAVQILSYTSVLQQ